METLEQCAPNLSSKNPTCRERNKKVCCCYLQNSQVIPQSWDAGVRDGRGRLRLTVTGCTRGQQDHHGIHKSVDFSHSRSKLWGWFRDTERHLSKPWTKKSSLLKQMNASCVAVEYVPRLLTDNICQNISSGPKMTENYKHTRILYEKEVDLMRVAQPPRCKPRLAQGLVTAAPAQCRCHRCQSPDTIRRITRKRKRKTAPLFFCPM